MTPEAIGGLIFLLNVAATGMMIGIIWFVQIVHYPLFAAVGAAGFPAYAGAHGRRTGIVVAGPMLVELATGVLLVWNAPPWMTPSEAWAGLVLIGVIWFSTAFLQVPRHSALASGFNRTAHRALVATNWVRTVAWTLRGALLLYVLGRVV